jgi:hypothetical protein
MLGASSLFSSETWPGDIMSLLFLSLTLSGTVTASMANRNGKCVQLGFNILKDPETI